MGRNLSLAREADIDNLQLGQGLSMAVLAAIALFSVHFVDQYFLVAEVANHLGRYLGPFNKGGPDDGMLSGQDKQHLVKNQFFVGFGFNGVYVDVAAFFNLNLVSVDMNDSLHFSKVSLN